ncbi:orotidine-5'-phosphate decarboxylase [Paradesulfitobacterium aromaticivorans]
MSEELTHKVMVALDVEGREQALALARELSGSGCWLKVGLELYAYAGLDIIRELKELGFPIFLDLKLHDIPTTVARTVRALAATGVDMLNVHCSGGYEMMARAAQSAREVGVKTGLVPKVIGVTVLTSMTARELAEDLGLAEELQEHVLRLALLAKRAGLDGVVASAQEAPVLRRECGENFLLVTPGIRPAWSAHDDQARILTPRAALAAGSSYLVVGRPITRAAKPRLALTKLWEE